MSTIRAESLVDIGRRTSPPVARSIAAQSGHSDSGEEPVRRVGRQVERGGSSLGLDVGQGPGPRLVDVRRELARLDLAAEQAEERRRRRRPGTGA